MRGIDAARSSPDEKRRRVAKLVAEQVFDNARVSAVGPDGTCFFLCQNFLR
jgi:hypothetical protein